jgi:hypothetical protein
VFFVAFCVLVVFNILISILMDAYAQANDEPMNKINIHKSFYAYLTTFRALKKVRGATGITTLTQKYSKQEAAAMEIQAVYNDYTHAQKKSSTTSPRSSPNAPTSPGVGGKQGSSAQSLTPAEIQALVLELQNLQEQQRSIVARLGAATASTADASSSSNEESPFKDAAGSSNAPRGVHVQSILTPVKMARREPNSKSAKKSLAKHTHS